MDIQPFQDLLTRFLEFLPSLIAGLVIFVVSLVLSSWLAKLVGNAMRRRKVDPEIILLTERIVRITVLILGTVQALAQVNFNVTGFVAGLGILGFTVGFALQDVTKNFVAGILLLVQQPFDIGDEIEVAGYTGEVKDISLRTTEIITFDGLNVLIPNGDVFVRAITNYTRDPRRRLHMLVTAEGRVKPHDLTAAVLQAIDAEDGVLDDPRSRATWTSVSHDKVELDATYWAMENLIEVQNRCAAAVRRAVRSQVPDVVVSVTVEPVAAS